MNGSSLLSAKQAARSFVDGRNMTAAQRSEVIRCIVDDVLKACKNPSRTCLSVIAEKIMAECPKLQDVIDGRVVGCGYASIRNQLENHVSYLHVKRQ